jgi:hypothetical protein
MGEHEREFRVGEDAAHIGEEVGGWAEFGGHGSGGEGGQGGKEMDF